MEKRTVIKLFNDGLTLSQPVTHIIHIADIHIRLNSRQDEYLHVFNKLYRELELLKEEKKNCIIVICGDILHSKIDLSPECVNMTIDFFEKLSYYFSVFCIAGNHDFLMNNKDRLDSLSSILYKRTPKNFFYLRETGIYEYNNVHFYINSLLDSEEINMTKFNEEIDREFVNIALYHGSLFGWKNLHGFQMKESSCDNHIKNFSGMDLVLLGDIHCYQVLSDEIPHAAYSSSLISQNYSEFDENHGYILWNLDNLSHEYKRISNDYRYQNILLLSSNLISIDGVEFQRDEWNQIRSICPKGKVKFISHIDDNILSKEIYNYIIKLYETKDNTFSFQEQKKDSKPRGEREEKSERDIVEDENNLILWYLRQQKEQMNSFNYEQVTNYIMRIFQEHKNYSNSIIEWHLKRIEFTNLFGYGKDNVIDLSRHFKKIIGIFGENGIGKSSIIDIISVLCFDKCTRYANGNSIPKEVINDKEQEGFGSIILEIHKKKYKITKKYKRSSNNMKITQMTKFYIWEDELSIWKELTGEQRKKTNQLIENIISSFDMFIFFNCILQVNRQSFREYTMSKKRQFLNTIFGYGFFESLEKKHKTILKELEFNYKLNDEQSKDMSLIDLKVDLEKTNTENNAEKKEFEILKIKLKEIEETTNKYYRMISKDNDYNDENIINEVLSQTKKELYDVEKSLKKIQEEELEGYSEIEEEYKIYSKHPLFSNFTKGNSVDLLDKIEQIEKKKLNICFLEQELKQLYEKYNSFDLNVEVDNNILLLYDSSKYNEIQKVYEKIEKKDFHKKEIELISQLSHKITELEENKSEKNMVLKKEIAFLEKKIESININLSTFSTQKSNLTDFDLDYYIEKHKKFRNDEMYTTNSPLYSGQKQSDLWIKLSAREKELAPYYSSIQNFQREINSYNNQLTNIQDNIIRINYNKGVTSSSSALSTDEECKKLMKKNKELLVYMDGYKPNFIENIIKIRDDEELKKISSYEFKITDLKKRIKFVNNSIASLKEKYVINKNCKECLANPLHIQRITFDKEKVQLEKELNSLENKYLNLREIIIKSILDLESQDPDKKNNKNVLFSKFEETEKKASDINHFLMTLIKCNDEVCLNQIIIDNFSKEKKVLELEQQKKQVKDNLMKKQTELEELYFFYNKKELIEYISLQWSIKIYSYEDILRLKEMIANHEVYIEEKNKTLNILKEKQKEYQISLKEWKKDSLIYQKIKILKSEEKIKSQYKRWLSEISKYEKKENQTILKKSITYIEKQIKDLKIYQENKGFYSFIKKFFKKFDINVDYTLIKIRENQLLKTAIELKKKVKDLENDYSIIGKINHINKEKDTTLETYEFSYKKINTLDNKIEKLQKDISYMEEKKKHLYELEKKISIEKDILKVLGESGLPLFLISRKLNSIENSINSMIDPFFKDKKRIIFTIDENNINFGFASNNSNSNQLCGFVSGMEGFIMDVSLKFCLSKYSSHPTSDFFFIDEKISVLDKERMSNIDTIFDFLKNNSRNVLLISHLDNIKDFCDSEILIQKQNSYYSSINFT